MFTDLAAAIDEARFLSADTGRHHCITQRPGGVMYVRQERNPRREIGLRKLYTTRQDQFGTVNTDGVGA